MPRPLSITLLAILFLAKPSLADDKAKPSPAAKKILDKAVADVKKNRQEFDKANQKPLGEAKEELQELAKKLVDDGKADEAGVVLKQMGTLEADVMKMANAPAPVGGGGGRVQPQKPLLERLEGKWDRDAFGDGYIFHRNGAAEARQKATGKGTNMGRCRALTDDSGVVEWDSGHRWAIRIVGDDWVAIRETKSGEATCSGIVLTRIK